MGKLESQRLSILKMIESGRVTADEGLRLLEALDPPKRDANPRDARCLRIQVTELGTGRRRALVNVPIALVDLALRLVARDANRDVRVAGQRIDPEVVSAAVRDGSLGRVLDLTDDEEKVKVEVFLE